MKKRILKNIQKAQAEAEFGVELVRRQKPDFIRRVQRNEKGDRLDKDGNIVLTQIKTDSGKTMTPSEQFRLSPFSPHGRMLRALRKARLEGSEVGMDKNFEQMLNGETPSSAPAVPKPIVECFVCQQKKATHQIVRSKSMFDVCEDCMRSL